MQVQAINYLSNTAIMPVSSPHTITRSDQDLIAKNIDENSDSVLIEVSQNKSLLDIAKLAKQGQNYMKKISTIKTSRNK